MVKKMCAAVAVLALAAPAALAASHFVKVSPGTVKRGHKVTVSGSVGNGATMQDRVPYLVVGVMGVKY